MAEQTTDYSCKHAVAGGYKGLCAGCAALDGAQTLAELAAILTPCAQLAGTVYSVSRGFKAGTLSVTIDTPYGMSTLAVPAECAGTYLVGALVSLSVSVGA